MTLPNFLIIGAPKCGTTSLFHYLKQHPDVFLPELKETRFFSYNPNSTNKIHTFPVKTWEHYQSLFNDVGSASAIGEASPQYLYSDRALEAIHEKIPNPKLIVIVRNPTEKILSGFMALVALERESSSFEEFIEVEKNLGEGYYTERIKKYQEKFGAENLRVYLFDDLVADRGKLVSSLFSYLEVDHTFEPIVDEIRNKGGVPKNRIISKGFNLLRKLPLKPMLEKLLGNRWSNALKDRVRKVEDLNREKLEVSDEVRSKLIQKFTPDIMELEKLIDRDLSHWYAVKE